MIHLKYNGNIESSNNTDKDCISLWEGPNWGGDCIMSKELMEYMQSPKPRWNNYNHK